MVTGTTTGDCDGRSTGVSLVGESVIFIDRFEQVDELVVGVWNNEEGRVGLGGVALKPCRISRFRFLSVTSKSASVMSNEMLVP